jgi:hypothetical protein
MANGLEAEETMKAKLFVPILAAALASAAAFAQQDQPKSGAAPTPEQQAAMNKQMQRMQERMKTMHEQMERIQQTKDPKERQELLQQHMQTMQEQMTDMRMMGGGMMMGMVGRACTAAGCTARPRATRPLARSGRSSAWT